MKTCKVCKKEKDLHLFIADNRNKDGRGARCKECANSINRQRRTDPKVLEQHKQWNKEYYQKNKVARSAVIQEWSRQNPEKVRKYKLKHRYGISADDYDALLKEQDYKCAICGGQNENGWSLYVDHDHACCSGDRACGKCVRGLLCQGCNMGLGNFKDNPHHLEKAIEYLYTFKGDK